MRVGILGYGRVASVHAHELHKLPSADVTSAYGPDLKKAADFASAHDIPTATDQLDEALSCTDAVVVCSPTAEHFQQALSCIHASKHVLVELPPCSSLSEAQALGLAAKRSGSVLQCAHTSRYIPLYRKIRSLVRTGQTGAPQQLVYVRHLRPVTRSWDDDALLHHAAHPLDLLLDWFGEITCCCACLKVPRSGPVKTLAFLLELPGGAPAAVSISYSARLASNRLTLVAEHHTLETEGFAYLRSDRHEWTAKMDEEDSFTSAVREQDLAFLEACEGAPTGVLWEETQTLMQAIEQLQREGD